MPRTGTRSLRTKGYAVILSGILQSGCASLYPQVEAPPGAEPEPEPAVVDTAPIDEVAVASLGRQPWNFELPSVAIIMTNSEPAYADVAVELAQRLENYEVYDLGDASLPPVSVLNRVNDSAASVVVAIGLRAARSAVAMADAPVIFSQVFNHQDHGLLTENSRGIASVAPLDAQLAAWKEIDPTIARVGVILGDGHEELIEEAQLAAANNGVELHIQVTHSDQETLYFFRRMIRDIDGFWLFPDNRILSGRVLQEMLADADRQKVPVAVPSESMLKLGASLSISTVAADIARTIVKMIREIQAGHLSELPPITRLSEIRVETSGAIQVVDR